MIKARALVVSFAGRPVLDGVDIAVDRGEIVGLIGPPEAGKSVLLKTLAALVDGEGGRVEVDGERVDHLADAERGRFQARIGMAFQNDALFDALSVFDNVAFPLRRRRVAESELEPRVMARLREVGVAEARDSLPADISGGMRKRVGIARATVTTPELGLFDEPIAGLDPVSSARILDLIVELTRSLHMATLVVSNDLPALLPVCQRVVMLNAGRVAYDGPPAALARSERPEVVQFATGADQGPL